MKSNNLNVVNTTVCMLLTVFAPGYSGSADGEERNNPPNWGQIQSAKFGALQDGFFQPDMIYAPFVFWFWDEPLDAGKYPAKARDMAAKMMEQGMNPGYAHPRRSAADIFPESMKPSPNLPKDQWLSDKWFECFDAALESAEAGDGYFGAVDEYMWPIGRAAGRVLKEHPELQYYSIQWDVVDVAGGTKLNLPASFFTMAAQLDSPPGQTDEVKPMSGQWIWKVDPSDTTKTFYLRRTFDLKKNTSVAKAQIRISVDDAYQLFINGALVGEGETWTKVGTYDVATLLKRGKNTIAVKGSGDGGLDAMLCDLEITHSNKKEFRVLSGSEWKISKKEADGWKRSNFNDELWNNVRVLGGAGMAPWSLKETKGIYRPATIHSKSLQRIGEGEPFEWTAPSGGFWRVYTFKKVAGADVNVLDRGLAKAFIDIAHKPYAERYGERFGTSIPGIFCDTEGHYGKGSGISWSDDLADRYRANTSRNIEFWMPLMFDDDVEGLSARARVDWFTAMSDLYSGFHAAVSDWLEPYGVYYIANLWEESLQWQTSMVGDHMQNQRGFSMPGTDCLVKGAYKVHNFKEAQAVAEFEGRRLQSEIMGAGGWNHFNPVDMKQCVNAVITWGVGHIVPHGIFMTRDLHGNKWVPDWFDENPLWTHMHQWSDFVKRASYVNSHGHAVPDVLLLNPLQSAWALLGETDKLWGPEVHDIMKLPELYSPEVQNINQVYSEVMPEMTQHRIEYMIADAHYISQMNIEGSEFVRGDFRFKTVVMPPMAIMPLAQARAVLDFAKAGGTVYTLGTLPSGSSENGLVDPEMQALMKELCSLPSVTVSVDGLKTELMEKANGLSSRIEFVSGEFQMLQSHRRIDGRDFFWLVNNSPEARECVVQVSGASGAASIWDCETGAVRPAASKQGKALSTLQLAFQPHEAYWLVFDPQEQPVSRPVMALPKERVLKTVKASGWTVRIDPAAQPNLQEPLEIPAVFSQKDGTQRDLSLWETWSELPGNFTGVVDYTQTVTLPRVKGSLILDLGTVHNLAEVWVNGMRVGGKLWPPYRFSTDVFKPGKNEIRIRIGNLVDNYYGTRKPSGLIGPVVVEELD